MSGLINNEICHLAWLYAFLPQMRVEDSDNSFYSIHKVKIVAELGLIWGQLISNSVSMLEVGWGGEGYG